jgi:NAD(P)-dependent dehydrogenase (short-subunit alcohol dehydrogenase family)
MVEQGKGRIINIGSLTSFVAINGVAPHCASKGAVLMLTKALALEWAPFGVTVNALIPGFFVTELNRAAIAPGTERRSQIDARTPMGRVGDVEELVGAAVYLASDAAGFVTGTTLTVDGGLLANGL